MPSTNLDLSDRDQKAHRLRWGHGDYGKERAEENVGD